MNVRLISEWKTPDNKGKAKVKFDSIDESFFIEYYDNKHNRVFTEDFEGKSLAYVEDAAQNWSIGLKKIGDEQ